MRSLIFHLFSLSLLATSLAGCQLLVDNRAEGTTPVVVVTTDQWDMKVKAEHDYALKPELEALRGQIEFGNENIASLEKEILAQIEDNRRLAGYSAAGPELLAALSELNKATMMRLKELETLNKDNHATKKAENEQLYKKISSDIAMALAEIKGDAEALYKPLDVIAIKGSEKIKFVSETSARLAGCSYLGQIEIAHEGNFDDAITLLKNEAFQVDTDILIPLTYKKLRPNGVGETAFGVQAKMMTCPTTVSRRY